VQFTESQTHTIMRKSNYQTSEIARKSIAFFLLIILVWACKGHKEIITFSSIDYTFFAGSFESIKISSNGKTCISSNIDFKDWTRNYSLTLDKVTLDSLSKMSETLFKIKLDSNYRTSMCDHCIDFCLIIKSKDGTLLTSYRGEYNENELRALFHMTKFLDKLCYDLGSKDDSTFVFESKARVKLHLPSPPS